MKWHFIDATKQNFVASSALVHASKHAYPCIVNLAKQS